MLKSADSFDRDGYVVLKGLLDAADRTAILRHHRDGLRRPALLNPKSVAVNDVVFRDLAARSEIVAELTPRLGDDVICWGTQLVVRRPGQAHHWHSDIESCDPGGGFASLWIGLRNTSAQSGLSLLPGSHLWGLSIQQAAHEAGIDRDIEGDAAILELARAFDPSTRLEVPEVGDGDAILFDGRLWHGSLNRRTQGARTALLLQYARADRAVRYFDPGHTGWPYRRLETPRPPVFAVAGEVDATANEIAPAPPPRDVHMAPIEPQALPVGVPFRSVPQFRHLSPNARFEVHYSTLAPSQSPHPPHVHEEEELLVVVEGEAEIVLADRDDDIDPRRERLVAGQFAYYPTGQYHSIRNPTDDPVTYFMLKWSDLKGRRNGEIWWNRLRRAADGLRTSRWDARAQMGQEARRPFETSRIFARPTRWLTRLQAHASRLQPGGGYAAHVDAHDVAVLLFNGCIAINGERLEAPAFAWLPAGAAHDMANPGTEQAGYLVFEFHNRPPLLRR